jgi:hypothetical protein
MKKTLLIITFVVAGFSVNAQSTDWFDEHQKGFCKAIAESVEESMAWANPTVKKKILKMLEECAGQAYDTKDKTGSNSSAKKKWDYKYQIVREKVYKEYKVELPRKIS